MLEVDVDLKCVFMGRSEALTTTGDGITELALE